MKRLFSLYIDAYRGLSPESWMLAAVMLLNRAGSMVLPFLGVYMVDHLHFTLSESGFVLSFFGIGAVIGSFLGGYITDRLGEFRVQSFSLFASVVLFCLMPLFTTVAGLAAMIFVQSIISEIFRPANSVAITKYARPENITRAFSLNRMAINLGFSIGPALGGILSAISYRFLFYTNATAALIAGVCYVYFFHRRHRIARLKKAHKTAGTDGTGTVQSPYRHTAFIVFCLLCSGFSICFFQLLNTLPLFYKEAAKLSQQHIGILLGYSGLVVVLFEMLLVALAERRLSMTQTMVAGCLLCSISYGMLGFTRQPAMLYLSVTLQSFGEILILPFMATITAMSAGKRNKGAYMGMNGMAVAISFIVSPLLGTYIAARYGFNTLWIATGLILVGAGIGYRYCIPWLLQGSTPAGPEKAPVNT